ncbi:MAG TPA: hypothetical protein VLE73_04255 [Candidatus Saccharimonadales bacterium]|nr:hypothetical protein [Candidatus Saccharimonadales bacterium]
MKRARLLVGAIVITAFALLGAARMASAYSIHTGDAVNVSGNKVVQDTVYAAGSTVNIASEVYGDVFCAGQTVTITGTVHGDVICAGQTITITGHVTGDVRLAGQNVTVSAPVTGNATLAGQTFVLSSSGSIGGDATVGSSSSTLRGPIGRDLVVGGGTVVIDSSVGRDIKAQAQSMELASGAHVGGSISLVSQQDVKKDKGAVVVGKISRTEPTHEQARSKHGAVFGFGFGWFVYWLVALLVMTLALTLLFPRLFVGVSAHAIPRPWKALLVGFVASLVVPIIVLLSLVSIVGIPLAIVVACLWLAALLVSGPLFGFYLGRLILRGPSSPLLIALVGVGALVILYFIPIIGALTLAASTWIGTGMLLLHIFRSTPKPAYGAIEHKSK